MINAEDSLSNPGDKLIPHIHSYLNGTRPSRNIERECMSNCHAAILKNLFKMHIGTYDEMCAVNHGYL